MDNIKTKIQKWKGARDINIDWSNMNNWTDSMLSYPHVTYNRRKGASLKYYLSFHCLAHLFDYKTPENCKDSLWKILGVE